MVAKRLFVLETFDRAGMVKIVNWQQLALPKRAQDEKEWSRKAKY